MKKRARAINCECIERSTRHPDYHKYIITYLNSRGISRTAPAYGKDMEEALRKVRIELNKKRRKDYTAYILILIIITLICTVALLFKDYL
jgi:hypothetical protein